MKNVSSHKITLFLGSFILCVVIGLVNKQALASMTSTRVYPTGHYYCGNSTSGSFHDNSIAANADTCTNATSGIIMSIAAYSSDPFYINRGFDSYGLFAAGIPLGATIVSSSYVNISSNCCNPGSERWDVVEYTGLSTSTFVHSDFSKCDFNSSDILASSTFSNLVDSPVVNQQPIFTVKGVQELNTAVNGSGVFRVCHMLESDRVHTASGFDHERLVGSEPGTYLNVEWNCIGDCTVSPLPAFSSSTQFKSDATTPINEGDTTTEDTVVFGATLNSSSSNQLRLEVEVQLTSGSFTGTANATSSPVVPGTFATTTATNLQNGSYHWRARAVDVVTNAASDWQEFGTSGNTDFLVHQVPLYTQVRSDFPSIASTTGWGGNDYGSGHYQDCLDSTTDPAKSTIRRCGCAIASMSMLGRYYGITVGTDGFSTDPGTMNTWLSANDGYKSYNATSGSLVDNGNLNWGKAVEYLGVTQSGIKKTYLSLDYYNASATTQGSIVDSYINSLKPAIAYSSKFGHYFVINSKLANSNYAIRDPKWFLTKTLNETDNISQNVRGYNKVFDTANLFSFSQTPQRIVAAMYLYLASPAEYLVTDPQGRRLGVDPSTNATYNEIPSGSYSLEGPILDSDTAVDPGSLHMVKTIYISSPIDGNYDVKVIGTGAGSYTANSFVYDNNGNSQSNVVQGNTIPNLVTDYNLSFSTSSSQDTALIPKYNFGGFLQPIKSDGSGIYKLGRTLPVKFQLTDATGAFVTSTIAHLFIAKVSDGIAGTEEIPLSSGDADTGNMFRFDSTSNQYIFNLDTTPLSRGTWQLRADLGDGTTNMVLISLKN